MRIIYNELNRRASTPVLYAESGVDTMQKKGEYLTLCLERPDGEPFPLAVLLLDVEQDRLYIRIRADLDPVRRPSDIEIATHFLSDLADDALTQSGSAIIANLEDTLSNAIRITDRTPIELEGIEPALASLCRRLVVDPSRHEG